MLTVRADGVGKGSIYMERFKQEDFDFVAELNRRLDGVVTRAFLAYGVERSWPRGR